MNQAQFVSKLSKLRPGSTFLVLRDYRGRHGEVADFNIVFHVSYVNALKRSIDIVEKSVPITDLQKQARQEVLESLQARLKRSESSPVGEVDTSYLRFADSHGRSIKGVKLHTESNTLHLYGFVVHKRVKVPGSYPAVNKKPLTLAKEQLLSKCPVSKFRQFKITPDRLGYVSVENMKLMVTG